MATWNQKSVFACTPLTERGRSIVLNGDPKGKNMLYTNGKCVVIRDIANPGIADTYIQHSHAVGAAQYCPSGFYIASGDALGKLRIWDTVNKEHILKYEYQPFSGPIKDIAWSPDNNRIAVCGQGNQIFAAAIMWDTGTKVGEIIGHSKPVNSIAYKPTRPFRIATAGEDFKNGFYEGPPFKLKRMVSDHTRFANIVRFSPDGNMYCTGGSDGQAFLYDGKTGEKIGALGGNKAHDGSVFSLSWTSDSGRILTASGDKTCKLWDVSTQQVITEFKMGKAIEDQQVSCLVQGEYMLSVSLSGNINYLDKNNPDSPMKIIRGQNKNISCLAVSSDSTTLFAGGLNNTISYWTLPRGEVDLVSGPGHANLICSLVATSENLYSLGFDKNLKTSSIDSHEFLPEGYTAADRDPKALGRTSDGTLVLGTSTEILLVRDYKKVGSLPVDYDLLCVACHPTLPEIAVGGKDSNVHIYSIEGDVFNSKSEFKLSGEVNTVAYNAAGDRLAASGYARTVHVLDTADYTEVTNFIQLLARVNAVAWSPNGKRIVSCSVDTNISVYDVETKQQTFIRGAHPLSIVEDVVWINDNTFASCGHDCCIRVWEFSG